MKDSVLKRFTGMVADQENGNGFADESEVPDDLGSFGWLRGMRERAVMLELRRKSGDILAIGYGWLERISYDPSEGITLSLAGQKIRIKGRNLNAEIRPTIRLYEGLTRHRVPWVREADHRECMTAADTDTIVDTIEW